MKTIRDELNEIENRDPSQCAPDLCGMYERGATTTAIAAFLGMNPGTVANRLRAAGVTLRPKGPPRADERDAALIARRRRAPSPARVAAIAAREATAAARATRNKRVLELRARGLTIAQIANASGIPPMTVSTILCANDQRSHSYSARHKRAPQQQAAT